MSWADLVNNNLVGSGNVSKAAICGFDGSIWGKSDNFKLEPTEAVVAGKGFQNKDTLLGTGMKFEGEKYFVLQADDERIIGKKDQPDFSSIKLDKRELHLVRQENKFLPQYANRINFFHCSYNFSTEADIEQCNGCGNASFVHLSMRLLNRFDLTCVDLSHRAKCFDQNVECNSLASLPYEQCEGLRGIPVRESEGVSIDSFVKVLTANITELMNRTVVSQQIVALCPRCHFFGRPYYSSMDTCVQKLHTMRTGWPRQFQWCDWYQPSDKCV
ncbi:Profilin [Dirofilaria immitis]|nr:Profilin [Dirofilaria immitis]